MRNVVSRRRPTSLPWRLSRSVINAVDLAGVEFTRNALSARPVIAPGEPVPRVQNVQFWFVLQMAYLIVAGEQAYRTWSRPLSPAPAWW